MRADRYDDLTDGMASRAAQAGMRLALAVGVAAVFLPVIGWVFALGWLTVYAAMQRAELKLGPASPAARRLGPARYARLAQLLVGLNSLVFGLAAMAEAFSSDPLGPGVAGLLIAGAMVNAVLVTSRSPRLTAAATLPQLLYLVILAVAVIWTGRGVAAALRITLATGVLLAAAAAAWARISRTLAEMRRAQRAAEEANAAKSAFLATMSHEIRTPLNGVLGMAQAIGRDELSPRQRERLAVIATSGEALLAIIDDVLDLAKIEASKLELTPAPFDLPALVQEAHATFAAIAEAKGLAFELRIEEEARGWFLGDAKRIRQILYNMVSNAVKFTEAGGVTITVSRADGAVRLEVADTGPGVAPHQLPRLFEKFVQADASTTRRFGGTGLGLSICRELSRLMDGGIEARSIEPHGLVVAAALPLPPAQAPAEPAAAAPASIPGTEPPSRPLSVLAAEDHAVNRQVLEAILGLAGIVPHMVENGAEAVEAWRTGDWDVILMDVQMPVMDGPTAALIIRREERAAGRAPTPIVALTANVMSHQVEAYRAAGMDQFVAKPIQARVLIEAIAAATDARPARPASRAEHAG